jgi:hypothetical protein
MFKLLVTFIIVGFSLLFFWAIWNIAKFYLAPAKQKADTTSIDQIIETLKKRIEEAEADSANGVIEAEQRLESYKNQLTRAQDLKSKISHL